jgi:hypothetical protein
VLACIAGIAENSYNAVFEIVAETEVEIGIVAVLKLSGLFEDIKKHLQQLERSTKMKLMTKIVDQCSLKQLMIPTKHVIQQAKVLV